MNIFRANDVRGIYKTELKDKDAYELGNAFVLFTKEKTIVVGRDNRKSSPILHKFLIKGITDAGANVIDLGVVSSPELYFASHHFNKPAIMITASHNPPAHNGFYLCDKDAISIYKANGLKHIEELVKARKVLVKKNKGKIKQINISNVYTNHVLSFINKKSIKPLKIVVDAGNGVGSIISKKIYSNIPNLKIIPLFFNLDGSFPNRGPDTTVENNLRKLIRKVKQVKADFGCAFDGDADRIVFVDEKGQIVEGSLTGALIAHWFLEHSKIKEKIVYTIGCSRIVEEIIKKHNGIAFKERVGHSFVNSRMRKENAIFGIEHTGHYFYRKNFHTESPMITSLLMSEILSESNSKMSELITPLKKYFMTKEISFHAKDRENSFSKIHKALVSKYGKKIDIFDGMFLDLGDYWFRIRESQTESLIRLVIEGKNKHLVNKKKDELIRLIKSAL